MSADDIESRIAPNLFQLGSLGATVKLDLGEDGVLFLDGRQSPARLSREDREADCTLKISADNMGRLLDGTLDPMMAFTMGKLKVQGNMGVAMKLASLLED